MNGNKGGIRENEEKSKLPFKLLYLLMMSKAAITILPYMEKTISTMSHTE